MFSFFQRLESGTSNIELNRIYSQPYHHCPSFYVTEAILRKETITRGIETTPKTMITDFPIFPELCCFVPEVAVRIWRV